MKRAWFPIITLCILILVGCATVQQKQATGYKILATTASVYDASMKSLQVLYKEGLLTEEEKQAAIRAAEVFWVAWHEAELAMEIWFATQSASAEERALTLLNELQDRFDDMMMILRPLLMRAKK